MCVCYAKFLQSCLTLCYAMDHSSPSSSVHEIPQARILERVAMPSSRGSSRSRDQTLHLMRAALAASHVSCVGGQVLYHYCHLESPHLRFKISRSSDPEVLLLVCKGFQNYCLSMGVLSHFVSQKLKFIFCILSYYDPYLPKIIHTFG